MPNEAQMIDYVFSLDVKALLITLVILAVAGVSLWALIQKVRDITGFETKVTKEKRQMKESIQQLRKDIDQLNSLQNKDNEKMDRMMESIDKIQRSISKEHIEDMRWTILDFANALQSGRKYTAEAYVHIIEIYDEYELLLKQNGMENGRVDMAIRLIKDRYQKGLNESTFPL